MAESLLSILAAILAASAGAAAGSMGVVAIARIRKERSFDRQLEWCESMMKGINAVGSAIMSATKGDDPAGREDCWTQVIRLYEDLIPLCGLKELYAPKEAVAMILGFMSELEELIKEHLASHRANTVTIGCDAEACLRELQKTAGSLAAVGRKHLDLPRVTTDPKKRFLGSFRGSELGQHRAAFQ